jgi:hypothetical protein
MASLAEQFQAQPVAAQQNQIRAYLQQNASASPEQISAAMAAYGVSPQAVAQAVGNTNLPNAPAEVKMAQYQSIVGGNQNPALLTDINRALVARNVGLTPESIAQLTGMPVDQAQAFLSNANMQNPQVGQVSDEQIRTFMAGNQGIADSTLFANMQRFGVKPEQVSSALNIPLDVIQQRFNQQMAEQTPTGLTGFEQSIRGGLADATGTLRGAETSSRADIDSALQRINQLYGINIDDLRSAATQASQQINTGFDEARGYFQPYQQGGEQAFQQQLALSGALGQDAFNQANMESPYVAFLREQGMRANLAGASATGGLGGGNVQKELQRFGQGLASQGLQQQFQNLGSLSGMGFQGSQALSGLATGRAGALGDITLNTAQNIAGQRGQQAGYEGQAGVALANIGQQTGANIAGLQYGTGQDIAQQRARAGELLAGQIGSVMPQYSNLLSQMGMNQASLIGNQTGNLMNLQQQAANQAATDRINLSGSMGNLATGLGTNQANALGGQSFTQPPPFSYGQAIGGALGAAGAGYNLADMYRNQNPSVGTQPYVGPGSAQFPTFPSGAPAYQQPQAPNVPQSLMSPTNFSFTKFP